MIGLQYKGLRRIGEGDQVDIFNIIQKKQNAGVHLKVDEECSAVEGHKTK